MLQEQDGYLSPDGIEHVAELFELTPAEVRGTASFYDMFHLEPVGRYVVAVCTNIACMLDGAYELLDHIEESLGVHPGGTTADGSFTLEDAECLALCGNAPCVTVNWRFFGDMTPGAVGRVGRETSRRPSGRRGPPARHAVPGPAHRWACPPVPPAMPRTGGQAAPGGQKASRPARHRHRHRHRHRRRREAGGTGDVAHDPGCGQHLLLAGSVRHGG